ncbi:hypothetical protein ACFZB6_29385 [Streptomyces syringium]|uniref:hypothetical protein n=1 Tax=Streptomyces syringium TaxID=76729 RepID=UPI0036F0CF3D
MLPTEISVVGLISVKAILELAFCFHYAVLDARDALEAAMSQLSNVTRNGDYSYYADIAHFMGGLQLPPEPGSRAQ